MSSRRPVNVQRRVGEDRRAATRARILGAARELLSAGEPMAVMTVGRVAEAAGVSRATFYLYFPDKRELTDALTQELFAQWTPISGSLLAEPDRSKDEVLELIRSVVRAWREHAGPLAGLIEVAEYDADARRSWRTMIEGVAASIGTWLAAVRTDLDDDARQALAEVLAWGAERSLHQMQPQDAAGDERLAGALTELVWSVRSAA
ncbi:MAG: helix-turn-helix domain-containing protein [Solirubrobacteraceae bacterium]|nr:helix-turn-helix domain-containing protein [Solirubrobacteraceae bacterium]